MPERTTAALNQYRSLPKVELHRHLEGSLRLTTMLDIARQHDIPIPEDAFGLSNLVQVQDDESFSFRNFLAKFDTLRLFYRSPEVIRRITREAVEDAAKDNVRYMELRFTPVALSRAERFPLDEVMDWVAASARDAAVEFGVGVKLIPSVNRHEGPELAEQVAWLAAERLGHGVVGMDLAGNEAEFASKPFYGLFREARQAGLQIAIHAGEWGPAANVREAIQELGADRIAHGVRVLEDESVTRLARDHQTPFEVCVTSNYQSGVVAEPGAHPLPRMLDSGLNVTINTDDPSISRINLSHEYHVVCDDLGLSAESLRGRIVAAAQAAFLPEHERQELIGSVRKELFGAAPAGAPGSEGVGP
jgi:adenosine deaminase